MMLPSMEGIRAAVPVECFEKSSVRSMAYLCLDLVVIACLYACVPWLEHNMSWSVLFLWYCLLGMFFFSLFCVGHDCGHGTFSDRRWVNDLFGHLTHGPLMVPFWSWQKSHRQHHQFTSHLEKDKGHPWVLEQEYESSDWLRKNFGKIPLTSFIRFNPIYIIFGIPDGSHIWPWSKLFRTKWERLQCAASVLVCLLFSYLIFVFYCSRSPFTFFKYYYVPLLFQGYWMIIITYLQHQDENVEVYEEGHWAFVRGQLQTVDRVYGFGIDRALHHITDGHVAHHFFFTKIPHYHLPKATEAIRRVMAKYPGAYKRTSTYHFLWKFIWMNVKLDCLVGKGTGLLKYRSTLRAEKAVNKRE